MDAQGFLAALAPAVTDAKARESFLADPKAVLAAAGLDLPEWFTSGLGHLADPPAHETRYWQHVVNYCGLDLPVHLGQ